MARKKKHEEHLNHEAWAIPYGDLITLLLAFFVVMYSMSSVNEGKYRILSDSLVAAFRGAPKTLVPITVGEESSGKGGDQQMQGTAPTMLLKLPNVRPISEADQRNRTSGGAGREATPLARMAQEVQRAMQSLIDKRLVVVRRGRYTLEVEIRTDILFPSGVSTISPTAEPVLKELAAILRPFDNPVRVEGHTDNVPIKTREFPSNWELSAARAASVVHLFMREGLDPKRLEIIGLGEHRPAASNATPEGRNTNRRVIVVILENAPTPGAAPAVQSPQDPASDKDTASDKTVLVEPPS